MPILKVVQPTILKQDASKLTGARSSNQQYAAAVGTTLAITASAPAANGYLQIECAEPIHNRKTWFALAKHVMVESPADQALKAACDRNQVFQDFLAMEVAQHSNQNHLSFLDRGSNSSAYAGQIEQFAQYLQRKPDGKNVVSLGPKVTVTGTSQTVPFAPMPQRGVIPPIDQTGLDFLHADIQEACICVGSWVDGQMRTHWLGKNALNTAQFWSSTKIVPVLHVLCQANATQPSVPIQDCWIQDPSGKVNNISFAQAATHIVSYGMDDLAHNFLASNQLAAMMKRFIMLPQQEKWFRDLTGNQLLEFRGDYGEVPYIAEPKLCSKAGGLLQSCPEGKRGENLVSAYDLTRIVSMLGWHYHLGHEARLPAAQGHSLGTVVQAMGHDTARYLDVAIEKLNLRPVIRDVVILSKLGFGSSNLRARTELIYTGLLWFIDDRPRYQNQPSVLRTVALTLRAALQKQTPTGDRDVHEEARGLDARMAAEVTEILRRIVTQELA
jgi:hypothetical protein